MSNIQVQASKALIWVQLLDSKISNWKDCRRQKIKLLSIKYVLPWPQSSSWVHFWWQGGCNASEWDAPRSQSFTSTCPPPKQPSANLITPLKTKSAHLLLYNSNFSARERSLHSERQHSGEDVTDWILLIDFPKKLLGKHLLQPTFHKLSPRWKSLTLAQPSSWVLERRWAI